MEVSPEGAGRVKLEGSGTEKLYPNDPLPYDCFNYAQDVQLTALPDSGYQFDYWNVSPFPSDFNSNANPATIVDNKIARTIRAYFIRSSVPPQTPQNVSATDGTETGSVVITWDSTPGAERYEVYWADSLRDSKTLAGKTSETSYEDTNVVSDNVYYYWVRAFNQYGASAYSTPDLGYAYVDPTVEPPPPAYEPTSITAAEAKEMLDTDPDLIVLDVSAVDDFDQNHILCAINVTWNELFEQLDFKMIANYMDYPVLVYDQTETNSQDGASYLAAHGFSDVYHMTGGLAAWMENKWETVSANYNAECSLPPMAHAGPDQEVLENEPVRLDGSDSTAPDNGSLSYEWLQFRGTDVTIEKASEATASFTAPYIQEGGETLIFHLIVTDSQNNQDTDSIAVDVIWENTAPVAHAGNFQSTAEGETVLLDATGSTDQDDGIISYEWAQISGPEVEIQNHTSETARFTAPDIDTDEVELVFELTVTDKGGLSDTAQVSVRVTQDNLPPTAHAGEDQEVSETQEVILDGSDSEDPDDGIASYSWTQMGEGPTVRLSDASAVSPSFMAPRADNGNIVLRFQLMVTDRNGAESTDTVRITVLDVGDPPKANASSDKSTVYPGQQIPLDGSASESANGSAIESYQWTQISGPPVVIKNADSANPGIIVPNIDEENAQIVLELTVTDQNGLKSTDLLILEINQAIDPPQAHAGQDQEVRERTRVTIDGSDSSDPDDGIASFAWKQIGGNPAVELSDSEAKKTEFTAPSVDDETVLTFELTVTDYAGNEDTDEVNITVLPGGGGGGGGGGCFISALDF